MGKVKSLSSTFWSHFVSSASPAVFTDLEACLSGIVRASMEVVEACAGYILFFPDIPEKSPCRIFPVSGESLNSLHLPSGFIDFFEDRTIQSLKGEATVESGTFPTDSLHQKYRHWCAASLDYPLLLGTSMESQEPLIRGILYLFFDRLMSEKVLANKERAVREGVVSFAPLLRAIHITNRLVWDIWPGVMTYTAFTTVLDEMVISQCRGSWQGVLGVLPLELSQLQTDKSYKQYRSEVLGSFFSILHQLSEGTAITFKAVSDQNEILLYFHHCTRERAGSIGQTLLKVLQADKHISTLQEKCVIGFSTLSNRSSSVEKPLKEARRCAGLLKSNDSMNLAFFDEIEDQPTAPQHWSYWTDDNHLNYRNTGLLIDSIAAVDFSKPYSEIEQTIVSVALKITGGERGFLLQVDDEQELILRSGMLADGRTVEQLPPISRSMPLQVIQTGAPVIYVTMDEDIPKVKGKSIQLLQLLSVMCTPLWSGGQVKGVLYVDSKKQRAEFAEADLAILYTLGRQLSVVMEGARLIQENRRKQAEIESLNRQLQAKIEEQTWRMVDIERELARSNSELNERYRFKNIVGASKQIRQVFSLIERIAPHPFPVLIEGESGTGKELVARAIHLSSNRREKRFVSENCGAIPDSLFEAELFGHTKGAFTGADRPKEGLFRLADGGTLFLDEIANMSDAMQKGVLRVLQEGEVRAIGSRKPDKVDVRLICSTNIPLEQLVREGKFRDDLFYRLNVITIQLPPLRERKEDIPLLVNYFIEKTARETGGKTKPMAPEVLDLFFNYSWPGNVRELENEVRRLFVLSNEVIDTTYCSPRIRRTAQGSHLKIGRSRRDPQNSLTIEAHERDLIIEALKLSKGQKKAASEKLGISRTNLYQKIAKYGIERGRDY